MHIGDRIKARRKELGISVDTLCAALGKDRSTVYRYENGYIENLPIDVLHPIAEVLNTTPAYLMGWEEPEAPAEATSDIDREFAKLLSDMSEQDKEWLLNVIKSVVDGRK